MSGARDPPKQWTLSYDGFSSCFPVPILKLHSSCKVCLHAIEGLLFKHRNRRPHLTSEQMQISTPVHDLKCRVHVTQTTQGSIFALLLCLSTHCPLSEKMSTAGGFIKVLYYCWQINPFRVVKIPFNVHGARFYVDPHDVQKVAIIRRLSSSISVKPWR